MIQCRIAERKSIQTYQTFSPDKISPPEVLGKIGENFPPAKITHYTVLSGVFRLEVSMEPLVCFSHLTKLQLQFLQQEQVNHIKYLTNKAPTMQSLSTPFLLSSAVLS